MMIRDLGLPPAVRDRLHDVDITDLQTGRIGNLIVQVEDKEEGPAYLKIGRSRAGADLRHEAARLEWIADRLPVPRVLHLHPGEPTVVLMTALPGRPSHEWLDEAGPEHVVDVFAETLRAVHGINRDGCPFTGLFDAEITEASERMRSGLVDDGFAERTGMDPEAALDWLHERSHLLTDRVFTHGDYCMPNVLMHEGRLSGIVDWGLAGSADRNRDFMCVEMTLRLNLDPTWAERFYATYAEAAPRSDSVEVYAVLDEFFS